MKVIFFSLIVVIILSLLIACQGDDSGLVIKPAPIHEVEISIAESFPEQVFVNITGGLADSCTLFHNLNVERMGNTVKIEITTERPIDAVCAQVYGFFEKNVNLGSNFTSDQTYIVDVNGTIETFKYP